MPNHSLAIMRIYVFNVQIYGVFNVVDTVCIDYVDPLIHGIGKDYLREYCFVSVLPSLAVAMILETRISCSCSVKLYQCLNDLWQCTSGLGHKLR